MGEGELSKAVYPLPHLIGTFNMTLTFYWRSLFRSNYDEIILFTFTTAFGFFNNNNYIDLQLIKAPGSAATAPAAVSAFGVSWIIIWRLQQLLNSDGDHTGKTNKKVINTRQ